MNFLCIYLGEKGGGDALMHVYVWKHIVSPTEPLNGYLRKNFFRPEGYSNKLNS